MRRYMLHEAFTEKTQAYFAWVFYMKQKIFTITKTKGSALSVTDTECPSKVSGRYSWLLRSSYCLEKSSVA